MDLVNLGFVALFCSKLYYFTYIVQKYNLKY